MLKKKDVIDNKANRQEFDKAMMKKAEKQKLAMVEKAMKQEFKGNVFFLFVFFSRAERVESSYTKIAK